MLSKCQDSSMAPLEGKFAEAQRMMKYRSKKKKEKNILRKRKRNRY